MSTYEFNEFDPVTISDHLKSNPFVIIRNVSEKSAIKLDRILEHLDEFSDRYSELTLKQKLFRKRENHPDRKGDACMVTTDYPDTAPFFRLQEAHFDLVFLYEFYLCVAHRVLNVPPFLEFGEKDLVRKENLENAKLLLNWQEYFEGVDNSLPFHMDAEIFEGNWGKEYIDLKEGLLPRFVMVLVTKNENNGKGLKIMQGDEVFELNLNAGDLVMFDNTAVLHGVPDTTSRERRMVGFRSFELCPLYFSEKLFPGGEPFHNGFVNGFVKEISTSEARKKLVEKGWYYK